MTAQKAPPQAEGLKQAACFSLSYPGCEPSVKTTVMHPVNGVYPASVNVAGESGCVITMGGTLSFMPLCFWRKMFA